MNDRIRALRLDGWSERRIAAELGITRHRVRTALHDFRAPTPVRGLTWAEEVGFALDRARYRDGDDEQLALAELAYDVAEWLDEQEDESRDAERVGGSLRHIVEGVVSGSNPLVRIHAGRACRLMGETTRLRPEV